jgi:hypothetical protein
MSPEDRIMIRNRVEELEALSNEATTAAILLLADRLVGSLDGVLSVLRTIEERLGNIAERMP